MRELTDKVSDMLSDIFVGFRGEDYCYSINLDGEIGNGSLIQPRDPPLRLKYLHFLGYDCGFLWFVK